LHSRILWSSVHKGAVGDIVGFMWQNAGSV
jgi:hypothetical protein